MVEKNVRGIIFLLLAIFFSSNSFAQQDPQLSQFSLNPIVYNPAFTGINKDLSASLHVRTQWVNITGHPVTEAFNVNSYSTALHGGVGISVLNNEQGVQRNTSATLNYAFMIESRKSIFSIGLSGGIIQSQLDGDKLRAPDGDYTGSNINHNDNILPNSSITAITPNFSAGLAFKTKVIAISASANNLITPSINFKYNQSTLGDTLTRNYIGFISFNIGSKNTFSFKPSVLFKSNLVENQAEVNLICLYKKVFWFGAGYRGLSGNYGDAAIGLLGIRLSENLSVGYSYDYILSALSNASSGSHELLLRYNLGLTRPARPGKIIFTPRF